MSHLEQQLPKSDLGLSFFLAEQIAKELNRRCDKCGKHSDNLERVNAHSDFLYCEKCLEVEL